MSLQFFSHPSSQDRASGRQNKAARPASAANVYVLQLSPEQAATVDRLLHELFQSLTVLSGTCDLALTGRQVATANPTLTALLRLHARQAEAAMHELRDLSLTTAPVLTELSQGLTVLVLAADMIANDQIVRAEALSFYDLLRRNTTTTLRCLRQLYSEFGLE